MRVLTADQEQRVRQASAERFPHSVPPGMPARRSNLSTPAASLPDLWQFYGVPEVRAIADRVTSGVSRVNFMPCLNVEGALGDSCPPLIGHDGEIAEGVSPKLAADCAEIWSQVRSPSGPQSEIFGALATCLTVSGDAWQFGYPGTPEMRWNPEGTPMWVGVARQSITERDQHYIVAVGIDGEVKVPSSPLVDGHGTAIRVWNSDPRYPAIATSWMTACVRSLQILSAIYEAVAAVALSRMNAGLIIAPSDQDQLPIPSASGVNGGQFPLGTDLQQRLYDELGDHVEASAQEVDGWSRVVPAVVGVDSSISDKVKWVELARSMDSELRNTIDNLRHRIYMASPLPPEVAEGMSEVSGLGGGNVAAQIDQSEYQRAILPVCEKIAWANTQHVLREGLLDLGYSRLDVDRVQIGFSAKNLLMPPDRSDSAIRVQSLDRPIPALSQAEYREATGLGEFAGPEDEEAYANMVLWLAGKNPAYGYLLPEIGLPAPQAETLPPTEVVDVDSTETRSQIGGPASQIETRQAAAGLNAEMGVRLVGIATRYEERLATLMDSIVARMAERASSRVLSLSRGKAWAELRPAIQTAGPQAGILPKVRAQLAAEGVDDGDLFEPALAAFGSQFQTMTTRAQRAGVQELGGDWDAVEADANEANAAAWALLGRLLIAVAASRFDGQLPPEQTGEGTLSPFGIPSDVITRVSAVAGGQPDPIAGGPNGKTASGPVTTITTGPISETVAASQGLVVASYRFDYRIEIERNNYLPHLDMDGEISETEFFSEGFVGDHAGCLCSTVPIYIDVAL